MRDLEYINHITLNTGHSRKTYPDDVEGGLYLPMMSIIRDAQTAEGAQVLDYARLKLTVTPEGYVGTVYIDVDGKPCPILTTGGTRQRNDELWRLMHRQPFLPLATDAGHPPEAPYIADRLDVPHPNAVPLLADTAGLSICLAWALLSPHQLQPLVSPDRATEMPLPPAKLLTTIARNWPDVWQAVRKTRDEFRRQQAWPAWCQMPMMLAPLSYANNSGKVTREALLPEMGWLNCVSSMYLWRSSKGVYRFSDELYSALINQPMDGDIPVSLLHRLPEWAVYIETPNMIFDKKEIDGFIAHLDYNLQDNQDELQFLFFARGDMLPRAFALPWEEGSIAEIIGQLEAYDEAAQKTYAPTPMNTQKATPEMKRSLVSMIQLLLYLCSDRPDMPPIEHPRKRMRMSGAVDSPKEPSVWNVGVRIGAAMRKAATGQRDEVEAEGGNTGENAQHARPRPHVRRAHWHSYWTGPRDEAQEIRIRWLPPIPVNVDWEDEPPVTIKPVK